MLVVVAKVLAKVLAKVVKEFEENHVNLAKVVKDHFEEGVVDLLENYELAVAVAVKLVEAVVVKLVMVKLEEVMVHPRKKQAHRGKGQRGGRAHHPIWQPGFWG